MYSRRITYIGDDNDPYQASEDAVRLVQALAAVRVDACGVDLASLDVINPDAAIGVTWTTHTKWPANMAGQVRQRSREIRPGIFQVI